MGVKTLASELEGLNSVTEVDAGRATVSFAVDYGEYDALNDRVIDLLSEYNATLYSDDECWLDYTAVL